MRELRTATYSGRMPGATKARLWALVGGLGLLAGYIGIPHASAVESVGIAEVHRDSTVHADVAGSAVLHFGDAPDAGSLAGANINHSIMGMAATPTGEGYWLVGADGGVFTFGDAGFYGSTGGIHINQPIVGMAATPSGRGYWLVAADGGVFAFGDATFHGSTGGLHLNQPVVAMASTPSGQGYWLAASDGGIFSFGDAGFYGSTGSIHLNQPIVGLAASPAGPGYWLVAADGGVFAFGVSFYGSAGAGHLNQPIVGMTPTPSGLGYWLAAADGGIFTYGDAPFKGSAAGQQLNQPVIGIAGTHDGGGYWLVEGQRGAQSPFTPGLVSSILARPGIVSAAVLDLDSGRMYQYRPFANITASIVKVDILETLLNEAQSAGRSLSGSEQATATSMIEQSDNQSASALYADEGGAGPVTAYDRAAGMNATFPNTAWGLTTTTAVDQVTLVDRLAQANGLLSAASRTYALNLMEHVTPSQAWGVSGGVGPGGTVALKNGWLPVSSGWAVNSIGWIHGAGRSYILAVLSADQPSEQTGIDTISQVAAAAWASLTS